MNPTEFIRTLDELGRIVIPKELRKVVNWKVGDKIEVSLNSEDSLTLRLTEKDEN